MKKDMLIRTKLTCIKCNTPLQIIEVVSTRKPSANDIKILSGISKIRIECPFCKIRYNKSMFEEGLL